MGTSRFFQGKSAQKTQLLPSPKPLGARSVRSEMWPAPGKWPEPPVAYPLWHPLEICILGNFNGKTKVIPPSYLAKVVYEQVYQGFMEFMIGLWYFMNQPRRHLAPPCAKIGNLAGFGRDIANQQLLGRLRRRVAGQKKERH